MTKRLAVSDELDVAIVALHTKQTLGLIDIKQRRRGHAGRRHKKLERKAHVFANVLVEGVALNNFCAKQRAPKICSDRLTGREDRQTVVHV